MFSDEQNSREQRPYWETDSCSVSYKIFYILWKEKLFATYTRTHTESNECTQYHHNLFHKDPIQYHTSIYLQVSLHVTQLQLYMYLCPHAYYFLYQYDSWLFHHPTNILWTVCLQITKLVITTCNFLRHPVTYSALGQIFFSPPRSSQLPPKYILPFPYVERPSFIPTSHKSFN